MPKSLEYIPMSRRRLLTGGLASVSALLVSRNVAASQCVATPSQAEGPFYPVAHRLEEDSDLTWRHDRDAPALGQVVRVTGCVTDQDCAPVPRVLVEIWQACASGRYDHPTDENPAPMDPNFQYWGRTVTDGDGLYAFKTIKPGAYPDGPTWIRPPHIHFEVHRRGYLELTTQMYFANERYNGDDRILQRLSAAEQARVVIAPDVSMDPPVYRFDLGLVAVSRF